MGSEIKIQTPSSLLSMKVFAIVALCLIAYAHSTSCVATMYCMGCSATDTCDSCFNWGSGKVGARSLAANTCTASLTKVVTNAKYYSGTHTTTSNWGRSSASCGSSKHMVVDQTSGVAANYTSSCTSTVPTGATAVANCEMPGANKTSTTAAVAYCGLCKKGKLGVAAYTSCTGTLAITNCEYASGTNCQSCKSGYAVASTDLTCTAFTTDSNCRSAYYFNGATCKLFGSILAAGFAVAMAFIH